MKKVDISSANAYAFYNKDELIEFLTETLNDDQVIDINIVTERPDIDDPRTSGDIVIYTTTVYRDLMI